MCHKEILEETAIFRVSGGTNFENFSPRALGLPKRILDTSLFNLFIRFSSKIYFLEIFYLLPIKV